MFRHPELVSGSTVPQAQPAQIEEWMLKQVQHDGGLEVAQHKRLIPLDQFRLAIVFAEGADWRADAGMAAAFQFGL